MRRRADAPHPDNVEPLNFYAALTAGRSGVYHRHNALDRTTKSIRPDCKADRKKEGRNDGAERAAAE